MASTVGVSSTVSTIFSGTAKPSLVQNNGANTVYISDSPNVTPSTGIQLITGTPLEWPAGQPFYAICALGLSSSLTFIDNGAEIGVSVSALQTVINSLISVTQSIATPQPIFVNAVVANQLYDATTTLTSGIYVISCPAGVNSFVDFYDVSGNFIVEAVTVAGTVTLNIATNVGSFKYWTTSGVNTQIEILKQGSSVTPVSGTLNTYTASGTPGLVGDAYIVLVGGGGGGGWSIGGGGGSGGIIGFRANLTGTEILTIGVGGLAGASSPGGDGGVSSFAGQVVTGGGGGSSGGVGTGGLAGTPNGVVGGSNGAHNGTATPTAASFYPFFTQGSTGSGGYGALGSIGGGVGIGVGGGNPVGGAGTAGSGFGSGGGGGSTLSNGGAGTPGVCYIII